LLNLQGNPLRKSEQAPDHIYNHLKISNSQLQKESFNRLVDEGVYSINTKHDLSAVNFVNSVLKDYLLSQNTKKNLTVLDCGCGTGYWLNLINNTLRGNNLDIRLMGFDVSDRMIGIARECVPDLVFEDDLRVGDLLEPDSFNFENCPGFDLIFVYDTIQQLPLSRQLEACKSIISHLNKGGTALIFDHEKNSVYGLKMHLKKFLTKRFGIGLVPAFYCNAVYPGLARIAKKISVIDPFETKIVSSYITAKKALIITNR
jgi:SAM-dependent methyltransferase